MAETTSALLQLTDMETGGRDNTWGEINDANLLKLEQAIAGGYDIVSTGGALNLASSDDNSRNAILRFSGSLASNHVVTVSNRSKSWIVRNGHTLGAYTLTMKTASGSAITIPTGSHIVYCDGSNVLSRIGVSTVTNSDMATMAASTVKANLSGVDAFPSDVTVSALLAAFDGTALGQKIAAGVLTFAQMATAAIGTAAEIWANTASKLVSVQAAWSSIQYVALTDAATIAVNLSAGVNFSVTLSASRTLGFPTGLKAGQGGTILVRQNGTGGYTLTPAVGYVTTGGLPFSIDTTASRLTEVTYKVLDNSTVRLSAAKGVR